MKALLAQEALFAAQGYLRENPDVILRSIRNALGLRFGMPIDGLRWLGRQAERGGKVRDVQIDPVPPGLRASASLNLMKTPIRAAATIYVERVDFGQDAMKLSLRVEDVQLKLDGEAASPVAALIKSGALDLSNPGNLIGYLPNRPPIIVDARGNRIELDLMRDPKVGRNPLARHAIALLASFVTLHSVESDAANLDLSLRALPRGIRGAAKAVKRHVVGPSLSRFLPR